MNHRKILAVLLTLTLTLAALCGCAPAESQVEAPAPVEENPAAPVEEAVPAEPLPGEIAPLLSEAEFPRMDGSTANLPLMAAVLSAATGMDPADAENAVGCTTTPMAWQRLAHDQTDILLVYEAAEDTQAALAETDVALEVTPIGLDALVFIVNEQNPVEGLTQDQLRDIYTGQITNWKDLGGEDQEIVAFQRDAASGSQSLFRKLLLPDQEPMEGPMELRPSAMGGLIEGLASYQNTGNALGYSVFYYASYMYAKPGLRFLAVDGVLPSDETIADQSYPLLNPFYVAIRASEPEDSPARILRDWLLTEDGRAVLAAAGYIPVK